MSAIAGIWYDEKHRAEEETLSRMMATLAHRGPDGMHVWQGGGVALGHAMLHTTPESLHERQPTVSADGAVVLVADTRIDNRDEVLKALGLASTSQRPLSDADLILAAYERWGADLGRHLVGDFAVAVRDTRQNRLTLVRDHFGVRPLYYYDSPRCFAFATEVKALLAIPEVPRRVNEQMVAAYLTGNVLGTDRMQGQTSYEGIFGLVPGHVLTVERPGQARLSRYYTLEAGSELRLGSDDEYAEAFNEVFAEAVRCRLRSAFPIGAHLSGGLDSPSVALTARDLLAREGRLPLPTFSGVFDIVKECDEREAIQAILDTGGFDPVFLHPDSVGPLSNYEHVLAQEDEIYMGPTHYYPWILHLAAREKGVRVVLDGFDGDTTVGHGYLRFKELVMAARWDDVVREAVPLAKTKGVPPARVFEVIGERYMAGLVREGRYLDFLRGVGKVSSGLGVSRRRLLVEQGLKPAVPAVLMDAWHRLRGGYRPRADEPSVINPAFLARIGWQTPPEHEAPSVREEQREKITSAIMAITLEVYDRTSAVHGLDMRHPYMDKRLIEFCLSLPSDQKLGHGFARWIVRKAFDGRLPDISRLAPSKVGVGPNFDHGLLKLNRNEFEAVMKLVFENGGEYLNLATVRSFYERALSGKPVETPVIMGLWFAMMVIYGLRRHGLDQPAAVNKRSVAAPSIVESAVAL